jgi:hypothetical protein
MPAPVRRYKASMSTHQQCELASVRLQHVLSFFERVYAKLAVVISVNVALVRVLTTQLEALTEIPVYCRVPPPCMAFRAH